MNPLIAFRCQDGTYLLVPNAAALPWLENQGVEFLGEVDARSFNRAVATRIERHVAKWNVAMVSKDECYFQWSRAQEPTQVQEPAQEASRAPSRKSRRMRSLSTR